MMTMVMQKRGTIVPTVEGKYLFTGVCGTELTVSNPEEAGLVRDVQWYIDYHTKAIEVNQATLKHIEAQRLARAEAERLKLSPEQERLWGLVDKWKYMGDLIVSVGNDQWAVYYNHRCDCKRLMEKFHSRDACGLLTYDFVGTADPSDFPQEIRKPLLDKLCEVHQKTPGQLADWIEEQRRPAKPKFEVLSTDTFTIDIRSKATWLVREGREIVLVRGNGEPRLDGGWDRAVTFGNYVPCSFDEGIRRMREAGWDVQVKQVEPPAPPKPTWPVVKMGDKVKHRCLGTFIVAAVEDLRTGLVNIEDGRRWGEPISTDPLKPMCLSKLVQQTHSFEQWTKLTT